MNRRTLLSTLAGFFVGKKVVAQEIEFIPISRPPDTQTIAWLNQMYANLQKDCSAAWREGPTGPVGMPGPRGPSADGQKETEAEHAQRWADAEEWNRRWDEGLKKS